MTRISHRHFHQPPRNATNILRVCAALAAAALLAATARAADPVTPPANAPSQLSLDYFATSPTLTGDWGGLRKQMADKGLTFDLTLVQVYQGALTGSRDKGWNYGGREDIVINLDTQKMGLWPGGFINIEGEGKYGEFVGARQTGSLLPADANALFPQADVNNFDLSSLTFMQFVSPNLGFYVGKLATVTDTNGDANAFAHGKGASGFLNMNFNFNPILALTSPSCTLGAGAIILPTGNPAEFVISLGVLDTQGSAGTTGFDTVFKGGTTFLAEGRYTTHFLNLTGHQLLGAAYSDQLYLNLDQGLGNLIIPGLPVQQHSGSWASWYNFDQYLYQPDPKSDVGLGVFGRFGISDGQANPIHYFGSIGLGGKGLIPGRKNDQFGIGFYRICASEARIPEALGFRESQGFEAYYEIAITPAILLTPDIQVLQPSQQHLETACVLGLRLTMKF